MHILAGLPVSVSKRALETRSAPKALAGRVTCSRTPQRSTIAPSIACRCIGYYTAHAHTVYITLRTYTHQHRGASDSLAALGGILKHGLEIVEVLSATTPRRGRKYVKAVCKRADEMLEEGMDEELAARLAPCTDSQLGLL